MILETERLILRPWRPEDADDLFVYAKDPEVGPWCGWTPHKDAAESERIIRTVLNGSECYAVCLKTDGRCAGSIELMMPERFAPDECELGYWLARPLWGQGLIPEAAEALIRHGFGDLGMQKIWCRYFDGNQKSRRVQEKLGFIYQETTEPAEIAALGRTLPSHVNLRTREQWLSRHAESE